MQLYVCLYVVLFISPVMHASERAKRKKIKSARDFWVTAGKSKMRKRRRGEKYISALFHILTTFTYLIDRPYPAAITFLCWMYRCAYVRCACPREQRASPRMLWSESAHVLFAFIDIIPVNPRAVSMLRTHLSHVVVLFIPPLTYGDHQYLTQNWSACSSKRTRRRSQKARDQLGKLSTSHVMISMREREKERREKAIKHR